MYTNFDAQLLQTDGKEPGSIYVLSSFLERVFVDERRVRINENETYEAPISFRLTGDYQYLKTTHLFVRPPPSP